MSITRTCPVPVKPMTAIELIRILRKFPPNTPVGVVGRGGAYLLEEVDEELDTADVEPSTASGDGLQYQYISLRTDRRYDLNDPDTFTNLKDD